MTINKKKLADFCAKKLQKGFVLGMPGTGKSWGLFNEILPAWKAANPKGRIAVLAFTNKAKNVIRDYARDFGFHDDGHYFRVQTIHKFAKLSPDLNDSATRHKDLQGLRKNGSADAVDLVVVDEVGMVDAELADALEDCWCNGLYDQVLYLGDYEQVKPVNGEPAIVPQDGDWVERLTEIKRSSAPDLAAKIVELNKHIASGCKGKRIVIRGSETIQHGRPEDADVVVAYRNATVQQHNRDLQGYALPRPGDRIYCDTLKEELTVLDTIPLAYAADYGWLLKQPGKNGEPMTLDDDTDSYNLRNRLNGPLKEAFPHRVIGLHVRNDDGDEFNILTVFGTGDFRDTGKRLVERAMETNEDVMDAFGLKVHEADKKKKRKRLVAADGEQFPDLKTFCKRHEEAAANSIGQPWLNRRQKEELLHPAVVMRGDAWSAYMAYSDVIFHADFTHARTVHACQGSSYDKVFVDVTDIARSDDDTYHRLLYVGISRAREKVFFG